ncbi:polysaccharide pyruvyl transferase family protein [Streptomyces sp. SID1121]|uniref:polysaccharide pyruvyl transferase family protein n=1 Tax=Streptomyces sp. SID1121 TaxID=3425888 RepID=UPI004056CF7F
MKRILIRSGKSPFRVASREEFLHQDLIGTNSGNLLFSDATHKILLTEHTEITSNGLPTDTSAARAKEINERYDVFVVPLANAFRPSFKASLDRLSTLIEQLTIPVVVLGVGAQADETFDVKRLGPIEASVKRFCRAVLERSASIGVRGELTASYLHNLGFSEAEVDIIGCPSMFLHGETFPALSRPGTIDAASRIAINLSPGAVTVGDVAGLADHAYRRFPHLTYFAQNMTDAQLLFWGDTSEASGNDDALPRRLSHPLFQENKVRVPLDPRTWLEELSTFDFAYGTRIHGNIAALLSGTPAVVLVHDSRTLELCRYFDIPHRMLRGLPGDIHPADLYEQADYRPLVDGHAERFRRFREFLDRNNLQNTFTHGDGGAAYETRLAALKLPAPIGVWDGSDDGAFQYRISRLHERAERSERAVTSLTKQNKELRKLVADLEKRLSGVERRAAVRIGPAIRRRVRRAKTDNA